MVEFELPSKLKTDLAVLDQQDLNKKSLIATGGDSKQIEFVYLDVASSEKKDESQASSLLPLRIERIDSLKLDHGFKINCLKYSPSNAKLYVSDTTQNLTIYDFDQSSLL